MRAVNSGDPGSPLGGKASSTRCGTRVVQTKRRGYGVTPSALCKEQCGFGKDSWCHLLKRPTWGDVVLTPARPHRRQEKGKEREGGGRREEGKDGVGGGGSFAPRHILAPARLCCLRPWESCLPATDLSLTWTSMNRLLSPGHQKSSPRHSEQSLYIREGFSALQPRRRHTHRCPAPWGTVPTAPPGCLRIT